MIIHKLNMSQECVALGNAILGCINRAIVSSSQEVIILLHADRTWNAASSSVTTVYSTEKLERVNRKKIIIIMARGLYTIKNN